MFNRIIENIKWLFNHPPTGLTGHGEDVACDYCGSTDNTWCCVGSYCICAACQKKVYDKVLGEEECNPNSEA